MSTLGVGMSVVYTEPLGGDGGNSAGMKVESVNAVRSKRRAQDFAEACVFNRSHAYLLVMPPAESPHW